VFLIPTYVGPSPIHGYGVFSAAPIPAGTLIWRFVEGVDLRLSANDLQGLPPALKHVFKSYCYREASGSYVLCGDNAKFMNHSTTPSCDDGGAVTVVPQDLPAGTELTCDYHRFDYDTIEGRREWSTSRPADPAKAVAEG